MRTKSFDKTVEKVSYLMSDNPISYDERKRLLSEALGHFEQHIKTKRRVSLIMVFVAGFMCSSVLHFAINNL